MTRSIATAQSELNQSLAHARIAKYIVKAHIEAARLLLDEDSLHSLQETARALGSDVATIESYLAQFGRIGFGNKRFAVQKKS